MSIKIIILCFIFLLGTVLFGEISGSSILTNLAEKKGEPYRQAVEAVIRDPIAPQYLEEALQIEDEDTDKARYARILLARIHHPEIFDGLAKEIQRWRDNPAFLDKSIRQGVLSGLLLRYLNQGPENNFVYVPDEKENAEWTNKHEGRVMPSWHKRKKVEKYTDAEVEQGIARNAAARQAVLEYFLKFMDECDVYEQQDMLDVVYKLWGPNETNQYREKDHVKDAVELIIGIMKDDNRPVDVRMRAAQSIIYRTRTRSTELKTFFMNIVVHPPSDEKDLPRKDIVYEALHYLEAIGDSVTLAELKKLTNGPAWKVEMIEKTLSELEHAIILKQIEKEKEKEEPGRYHSN